MPRQKIDREGSKDVLLAEVLAYAGMNRHAGFPDRDDVFAIGSEYARGHLGNGYPDLMTRDWVKVPDSVSRFMGHCQGFELRDEAAARFEEQLSSGRASFWRERAPGGLVVPVNVGALERALPTIPRRFRPYATSLVYAEHLRGREFGHVMETYEQHDLPGVGRAGRRFAEGTFAFQRMPKLVRNIALSGFGLVDVDVTNALPELLDQQTGFMFDALHDLALNREAWFSLLLRSVPGLKSRGEAKRLLLAIIFGASVAGPTVRRLMNLDRQYTLAEVGRWVPDLVELSRDVAAAADVLLREQPAFRAERTAKGKRRAVALILQDEENMVLEAALGFYRRRDVEPAALMFDGFIATEQLSKVEAARLTRHVATQTGYTLAFKQQPIDGNASE
jgi:hypothetical protein